MEKCKALQTNKLPQKHAKDANSFKSLNREKNKQNTLALPPPKNKTLLIFLTSLVLPPPKNKTLTNLSCTPVSSNSCASLKNHRTTLAL